MDLPNVVLVTVDSLRYDRCGFMGYNRCTTPTLDSIADCSLIFDTAYATGPHTPESVPGFMAGRYAPDIAYYSDITWKAIPDGAPTIASQLSNNNYRTFATITNPHLTSERNFDSGFDTFQNLSENKKSSTTTASDGESGDPSFLSAFNSAIRDKIGAKQRISVYSGLYMMYRYRQYLAGTWPSVRGETLVSEFVETLERNTDGSAPIFGWTHLMDVHTPLHPQTIKDGGLSKSDSFLRQLTWDTSRISSVYAPAYDSMYDSAVRYVDQQIERLIIELKRIGVWDNTVLIVTSDHGEALCERGVYGHHNHYLYDEVLRVPLLVRTPNKEQKRIAEPFSLAWLNELLSELLDSPLGHFPSASGRESHIEPSSNEIIVSDAISEYGHTVSVRDSENKYTKHFGETPQKHWVTNDSGEHWIFGGDGSNTRITTDRGEWNPHSGETAPAELRSRARELATDPDDVKRIDGELDQSTRDRLQDLGYIS